MRIPKLLRCTPWQELNDLIAGVLPPWEETPSDPPDPAPAPVLDLSADLISIDRPPRSLRTRVQSWLAGAVTVFAVGTLVYAVAVRPPAPATSSQLAAIAENVTAAPIPTIPEGGISPDISNGIADLHERVGRLWDDDANKWSWERPEDADVLVTLETVDFNNGQIRLTWTIENRLQDTINMPMTETNFEITDGTLEYRIDQRQSQPVQLSIKPGAKATATIIVTQPVRPSALTLQVTLEQYPFGKATWLVPVPPGEQ
jgi:hypothetical protein